MMERQSDLKYVSEQQQKMLDECLNLIIRVYKQFPDNPRGAFEKMDIAKKGLREMRLKYDKEHPINKGIDFMDNAINFFTNHMKNRSNERRKDLNTAALVEGIPFEAVEAFTHSFDKYLNEETSEIEFDRVVVAFGKYFPKDNPNLVFSATELRPTRAGIAFAMIYLERFGGLPSQKNNIKYYSEKYKVEPGNTSRLYNDYKNHESLIFAGITEHGKSINGRLEALENALLILQTEKNEDAIKQLEVDISKFKSRHKR